MRIHFICRGNVYRSRIAEAYVKSLHNKNVQAISSGVVANERRKENIPVIPFVRQFLEQKGIANLVSFDPVQLTQNRLRPDDVAVCINQRVYDNCQDMGYKLPKHTYIWDITDFDEANPDSRLPDPDFPKDFLRHTEKIYKQIQEETTRLIKKVNLRQT